MNRIKQLFERKPENVLTIYFTPGYPKLNQTRSILNGLEAAGTDMIEVGIPFSDPLADGPTIQASSDIALKNGMSLNLLFDQIEDIRKETQIPLVMMGYLNPVMQYGIEAFCKKCNEIGIDGVILPDLPLDVYQDEYKDVFEKYNIQNIFLITPITPDDRIKLIDSLSDSFIYVVSSTAITGAKSDINERQIAYFNRIKDLNLKNPYLIGFGISNNKTFTQACQYANGAIIGSAFIKTLGEINGNGVQSIIKSFVSDIRG